MKKYPLLYFTNIILNKEWKSRYLEITSRKKIHFQPEQNIYKEQLYTKRPSFMFLVVTLQHVLLCYVLEGFVAGAGVGLGFSLDDWFATTQTRGKKKQTHLLEKKHCTNNHKISKACPHALLQKTTTNFFHHVPLYW